MRKIILSLALVCLLLFLAGCAGQENSDLQKQVGVNEKNISYFANGLKINGIECYPDNLSENTPALVLTGGDGVSLEMLKPVCEAFAKEGLVGLAHENPNGSIVDSIEAVSSGVDYLQNESKGRKVSLWAHSSGTIFTFFSAYEKPQVKSFVETSGHFQIPICDARQAGFQDPNCAAYLNEFPAPILIVHGQNDTVVPVEFAYAFSQRLDGVKIAHEMLIVPDAKHEFMDQREGIIKKEAEFIFRNSN